DWEASRHRPRCFSAAMTAVWGHLARQTNSSLPPFSVIERLGEWSLCAGQRQFQVFPVRLALPSALARSAAVIGRYRRPDHPASARSPTGWAGARCREAFAPADGGALEADAR